MLKLDGVDETTSAPLLITLNLGFILVSSWDKQD